MFVMVNVFCCCLLFLGLSFLELTSMVKQLICRWPKYRNKLGFFSKFLFNVSVLTLLITKALHAPINKTKNRKFC